MSRPMKGTEDCALRIGAWRVDPTVDEISKDGSTVKLERRAMQLLLYLAQHADQVVSVEQLLDQVWAGVVVTPDSVYHAVAALRRIMGDDSRDPTYITNVPRRGYRLVAQVAPWVDSGKVPVESSRNPVAGQVPATGGVGKRFGVAAAILVAVGVVVVLGWHYWSSGHQAAQRGTVAMADKSIAVLPFVDMSEKKDQEYFGDGMAEEIIDLMVKIPGLRVIGRTSSFQFKGKNEDLRSIAGQLGVGYVLEGSVRKSGDRMRVTAELIDSRNGTPRWSQTYDRDFSEVLKLQDEIATKVVREVEADALSSVSLSRKTLRVPEAYNAVLQGYHATDSEQALSDFQRALDLDPSLSGAASALANTYLFLGQSGAMPPAVAYEKARNAAELALKLDPDQSDAHQVLSDIHLVYDWDWAAAERELDLAKASALQGLGSTQGDSSQLALTLGRFDDALKIANKYVADDPLDPQGYLWLSVVELRRGRLPEAEAAIRRNLELVPAFKFSHYILAAVLLERSEPEAALVESLKEPVDAFRLVGSAMAYFALGRRPESDAALAQLVKSYAPYLPYGIATVYAFRAESDEIFKWLDRAYAQRDPFLYQIKFSPVFDKLHDDPRYKAFLKKMSLPE
jgi:TolB-like protein/DNA-binding winged helix-turn-helix (wHTH) protein